MRCRPIGTVNDDPFSGQVEAGKPVLKMLQIRFAKLGNLRNIYQNVVSDRFAIGRVDVFLDGSLSSFVSFFSARIKNLQPVIFERIMRRTDDNTAVEIPVTGDECNA